MNSKTKVAYQSKGIVGHCRKTPQDKVEKMLSKVRAWRAGKPVTLSVQDPARRDNTHMKVSARDYWGHPHLSPQELEEKENAKQG